MSGDRSLDEFVPSVQESDDESGQEAEAAGESGEETENEHSDESETDGQAAVDPAESTYAWTPSGATCDACGASVERRWRDEGALVCGDCKSW